MRVPCVKNAEAQNWFEKQGAIRQWLVEEVPVVSKKEALARLSGGLLCRPLPKS